MKKIISIYDINKMMSSKINSKLVAHFWNCTCQDHDVSYMVKKLNISQSNLSKHISFLNKNNVLSYKKIGKKRFYLINIEFKNKWKNIIVPQLKIKENRSFLCACSQL